MGTMKCKISSEERWKHRQALMVRYRRGWWTTLAGRYGTPKLELPRAWEPLDRSEPLQDCEGTSSRGVFFDGN